MRLLLSSAYLPPVEYFAAIAKYGGALVEACENYQKQSYRNRCTILTANGKMNLNIPVLRGGDDCSHSIPITAIEIDYQENWPIRHVRAMEAAYRNSPFFEYYIDDISAILLRKEKSLFSLNLSLTKLLLGFCGIKADLGLTEEYVADYKDSAIDLRSRIHPKSKLPSLHAAGRSGHGVQPLPVHGPSAPLPSRQRRQPSAGLPVPWDPRQRERVHNSRSRDQAPCPPSAAH